MVKIDFRYFYLYCFPKIIVSLSVDLAKYHNRYERFLTIGLSADGSMFEGMGKNSIYANVRHLSRFFYAGSCWPRSISLDLTVFKTLDHVFGS